MIFWVVWFVIGFNYGFVRIDGLQQYSISIVFCVWDVLLWAYAERESTHTESKGKLWIEMEREREKRREEIVMVSIKIIN